MKKSFTIVYIPHNVDERIEERVVEYDDSTIVSCLTDNLKLHFKKRFNVFIITMGRRKYTKIEIHRSKRRIRRFLRMLWRNRWRSIQKMVDIVPLLQQRKKEQMGMRMR